MKQAENSTGIERSETFSEAIRLILVRRGSLPCGIELAPSLHVRCCLISKCARMAGRCSDGQLILAITFWKGFSDCVILWVSPSVGMVDVAKARVRRRYVRAVACESVDGVQAGRYADIVRTLAKVLTTPVMSDVSLG